MVLNSTTVRAVIEAEKIDDGSGAAESLFVRVYAKGELLSLVPDRPYVYGWSTGQAGTKAANLRALRLVDAVYKGTAFRPATVRTDINGKAYVSAPALINGRHMDRDLREAGV